MNNDYSKLKNVLNYPSTTLGGTRRKFIAQGAALGAVSLSAPFVSRTASASTSVNVLAFGWLRRAWDANRIRRKNWY
ncbi:MAG: hypothetical protein CM15mP117_16120 [Alphaproteobacteria bacterium]|nr:MAG: hypothetical protein CM15mP117_16120 [Alphaproteobacteria bacterium]